MDLPDDLRERVDRVQRVLGDRPSVLAKLEAVAEMIERTVSGCDAVSIALVLEDRIITGAATSTTAIEADLVQYAYNQGPCLEAAVRQRVVRIDVLESDERYRHFASGAIERGVQSTLSVPLQSGSDTVGSLNLYAYEPSAFDDAASTEVEPFARYAAELIAHSPLYAHSLDLIEGLSVFVDQQHHIARAIRHLMVSERVDEDTGLRLLTERAAAAGTTVVEMARSFADHEPPDPSGPT